MFVTPNFAVNTNQSDEMVSLAENENGVIDGYYVSENSNFIKAKLDKPNRLLLSETSGGQGLFLFDDGRIEVDFVKN